MTKSKPKNGTAQAPDPLRFLDGCAATIEDFHQKTGPGPDGYLRTAVITNLRLGFHMDDERAENLLDQWRDAVVETN